MLSSVGWKLCIVAMLLPWWAGCSAVRLGYGQGPSLAYWWLDGYVDFTSEQSPRVKQALQEWFEWHRATQLPDYVALLVAAQRLAVDKVTPEQLCRLVEEGEQRVERAFEQAVPALSEHARGLSPAQVQHIERRFAKSDDELAREHLAGSAKDRQEKALKRWQDRLESFYGPLDDGQRGMLVEGLAVSPFDARVWLDERRQRQHDIVVGLRRLLAERADDARMQAALRAFATQITHSPRAEYRRYRQRLADANCALVARLHNAGSAAQRQRAVDKLRDWEADLRHLMRAGGSLKVPAVPTPAAG